MTQAATQQMTREFLEVKYEQYRDAFSELDDEAAQLRLEVVKYRSALKLLDEGLRVLGTIAIDAKPTEYDTLCRDFSPFKNLMATAFGKDGYGTQTLDDGYKAHEALEGV